MDSVSDSVKSIQDESVGFFNYVFNFDNENKMRIMNMLQYTLLAIIPILLILRGIKHLIPEDDDSKGSFEILAESIGQVILIMLSIWITNKIINYIPTYSGDDYPKFNEISFVLPFILLLATMQTKLGAKFNILIDRTMNFITGNKNDQGEEAKTQGQGQGQGQGQNVVRVTQPLGGGGMHQPSQADYLDRTQLLPSNPQMSAMPTQQAQQAIPDVNSMYQQPYNEPIAANEGGGWGSAW